MELNLVILNDSFLPTLQSLLNQSMSLFLYMNSMSTTSFRLLIFSQPPSEHCTIHHLQMMKLKCASQDYTTHVKMKLALLLLKACLHV